MKTSTTLALLLTGSVILNAYFAFIRKPLVPDCPIFPGFAKYDTIHKDSAHQYIKEFQTSMQMKEEVMGGYITRTALDDMLKTKGCNGIYYSFARDSSGIIGPEHSGVFLLLAPAQVKLDDSGQISQANALNTYLVKPRPWCPPNCIIVKGFLDK